MEKEIIWTEPAKEDLQELYEFNSRILGEEKSYNLIEAIIEKVDLLYKKVVGPTSYKSDIHPEINYQKLIVQHCIIIFRESDSNIYNNRIFDTRQNPNKLGL